MFTQIAIALMHVYRAVTVNQHHILLVFVIFVPAHAFIVMGYGNIIVWINILFSCMDLLPSPAEHEFMIHFTKKHLLKIKRDCETITHVISHYIKSNNTRVYGIKVILRLWCGVGYISVWVTLCNIILLTACYCRFLLTTNNSIK